MGAGTIFLLFIVIVVAIVAVVAFTGIGGGLTAKRDSGADGIDHAHEAGPHGEVEDPADQTFAATRDR